MNYANSIPNGFPTTVTVAGEEFPLYFTISPTHSQSWAYLIVNDLPAATIHFLYKNVYQHSIDRAEAIIKSLRKNDHKLFCHYPLAFGIFDPISVDTPSPDNAYNESSDNFDLTMIDKPNIKVDVYSTCYKDIDPKRGSVWRHINHLFVSNENNINFVVFDKTLMKAIISRYNKHKRTMDKIRADTHNLPANMTGEA